MDQPIEVYHASEISSYPIADPITLFIDKWLLAKSGRSGSVRTRRAYHDAILSFRTVLIAHDLDLLVVTSNGSVQMSRAIALAAQDWAGKPGKNRAITAATFNQRLAILSSFYTYIIRQGIATENPISRVERRAVQGYANAMALDAPELKQRLKAIDRSTVAGQRDYALIVVALQTGRRVAELAGLRCGDLDPTGTQVQVTWRRCKGGKVMYDNLSVDAGRVLHDYLRTWYGSDLASLSTESPVWISLSPRNRGQAMTVQTIADVCLKRLGISKVHTLRHTYAHLMEKIGAPVSEIQARLGHESLQTTGRYLTALKSAENPYADGISSMLGLGE